MSFVNIDLLTGGGNGFNNCFQTSKSFPWSEPQPGVGGEVSPRKSVVQSACQYDVTSRVSDFQNGEQRVYRRDR